MSALYFSGLHQQSGVIVIRVFVCLFAFLEVMLSLLLILLKNKMGILHYILKKPSPLSVYVRFI